MRVLIVSQYFPPEPGATQNRLGTFAEGLASRGHEVTVVCEQPCHPEGVFHAGFGHRPVVTGRRPGLTVHRVWVATSPVKSTARRLAFYSTFALAAAAVVARLPRPDVVLASSPPLPGVLAAAAVARARRIPLVVDIRDLWPAAAEALGELSEGPILRMFERAERWLYRRARVVTATTRPFCRAIDSTAGRAASVYIPNGALDELVALPPSDPPAASPFVVGYAGNFGIAQGLSIALDAAELLRREPVRFALVGGGPLAAELRGAVAARDISNVEVLPPIPVAQVGAFLQSCHALLVPLSDHPLLGDFIPSKLYDAMAVGRPALVAARGEAAALIEETGAGLVIGPQDGPALAQAVRRLAASPADVRRMGGAGRDAAAGLARSRQVDRLESVVSAAAGTTGLSGARRRGH